MNSLTVPDYLTILLYLGAVGTVGFWVGRRQRTTDDYFVANRRLPGWAVTFSIIGTVISSVSFIAFPAAAFAENWRLIVPNLTVPVILIFVTMVAVPFYRNVIRMTSYEYLERRFGIWARLYGSTGFVVLRTVDLGFTLLLTSIAVEVITGWDIRMVIVGIGLFTVAYTLVGGIEAVVWNDVIQGLVLAAGAASILLVLLFRPEGGPVAVISTAFSAGKFSLGEGGFSWQGVFAERPPAWLFVLSGLSHFGRAYIVEQNVVQRYLLARSDREAQKATFTGAISCVFIWLTFVFIGSCLWSFYQLTGAVVPAEVLQRPDNILPYFIATQLPAGVVGLLLAAIFAAAMQAVSADLTSVATVTTQDYFARFFPGFNDRGRLLFGRFAVLVGGMLATGVALHLTQSRTRAVYAIFVDLTMILAGGMLGLFALGFLSTRASRRGAYAGISLCIVFVAWATITGPLQVELPVNFRMHPLMIGILSQVVLFGSGYLVSFLSSKKTGGLAGLTVWTAPRGVRAKALEASR